MSTHKGEESELQAAIVLLARKASNPPPQYWLEDEPGPSYCWMCAKKARALQLHYGRIPTESWSNEAWSHFNAGIGGGVYYSGESDCSVACETCGALLAYVLLRTGAVEELDHYRRYPLKKGDLARPGVAYQVLQVLEAAQWTECEPLKKGALTLAKRVLRLTEPVHV